jgi:hypothetical protein
MDLFYHIENTSTITSFFNGKNLPLLFANDTLKDKATPHLNAILNIGCNLKKGRSLSKNGRSYLILKPEVRKRCFLSIYDKTLHKNMNRITTYYEDFLANLKDE